jgi:hypothetical protein
MIGQTANAGGTYLLLTSSRDRACLNTLIVLLVPTKGSVLRLRIPTLATVSLRDRDDGYTQSWMASENGGYEPHAKELYGYLTTERLFEARSHLLAVGVRGLVQLVREGDLFYIVLRQQAHLVVGVSESINNQWSRNTLCNIPARARAV